MPITNPFETAVEERRAVAAAAPQLKVLADEYREIRRPLRDALTAVQDADFRTADATFEAFVTLGTVLKAERLIERFVCDSEERYTRVGYVGQAPTDRQRALWSVREMTLAGTEGERPRFQAAFDAVTTDPDARSCLAWEVGQLRSGLMSWVIRPHIEGFHQRAVEILKTNGVVKAYRIHPNHKALLNDESQQLFRAALSDDARLALGEWKEWQDSPGGLLPPPPKKQTTSTSLPPPDTRGGRLTTRKQQILLELLDMKAVGWAKRTTRNEVTKRVVKGMNGAELGRDFAALSQAELTDSATGPDGGVWLTAMGKMEAERLRNAAA